MTTEKLTKKQAKKIRDIKLNMSNQKILSDFKKENNLGQYAEIKLDSAICELMNRAREDSIKEKKKFKIK